MGQRKPRKTLSFNEHELIDLSESMLAQPYISDVYLFRKIGLALDYVIKERNKYDTPRTRVRNK